MDQQREFQCIVLIKSWAIAWCDARKSPTPPTATATGTMPLPPPALTQGLPPSPRFCPAFAPHVAPSLVVPLRASTSAPEATACL